MKRILVVDDSIVSRKMLRKLFESEGHEVFDAVNGKDGYEQYVKLSPDVVTMDITMPEMNGIESLRLIKEHDPNAKVILITAAGQLEKKAEADSLGAVCYLTKPYDNKEILAAINNC